MQNNKRMKMTMQINQGTTVENIKKLYLPPPEHCPLQASAKHEKAIIRRNYFEKQKKMKVRRQVPMGGRGGVVMTCMSPGDFIPLSATE
jgi:hypothetical protein